MAFKFEALNLAHFTPSASITKNFSFDLGRRELSSPVSHSALNGFIERKVQLPTNLPASYRSMTADLGAVVKSDASHSTNAGSAKLIRPGRKPDQALLNANKEVDAEVERLFRDMPPKTGNPVDDLMNMRHQMHINNLRDERKPSQFDILLPEFAKPKK